MENKNYWEEFRKEYPETIGEKDLFFYLGNYKDWLEKKLTESLSPKIYEIDFEGSLLTQIKVSGSEIEIIRSVNGYGNAIKNPRVSEGKK